MAKVISKGRLKDNGHIEVKPRLGKIDGIEVQMFCYWLDELYATGWLVFSEEEIDQLIQELQNAKSKREE